MFLAMAFLLVMLIRSPLVQWRGGTIATVLLWLPLGFFVAMMVFDLGRSRGQRWLAAAFLLLVFVATFVGRRLLLKTTNGGFQLFYWSARLPHLESGISPILPVLLLLAVGYWWAWLSLRGISLVDLRRPRLPDRTDLPSNLYRISDEEGEDLRKVAHPLIFNWKVLVPLAGLLAVALILLEWRHPLQALEGLTFDWGYSAFLAIMIAAYLSCLLRLVFTWFKCRQILAGIDRLPLREAFTRMKGLSWHSLWTPGGSTIRETYKVMTRGLENLARLRHVIGEDPTKLGHVARKKICEQISSTTLTLQEAYKAYEEIISREGRQEAGYESQQPKRATFFKKIASLTEKMQKYRRQQPESDKALRELMGKVEALQKQMARTAAFLIDGLLVPSWASQSTPVVSQDKRMAEPQLAPIQVLAEEFAALVYVNFLITVLLRMRTLVICAAGMYVFIVASFSVYPFEPHVTLQMLAIALLVFMGACVGYVYAEMHREAVLSRLTDTEAGELGWDFWVKFASAAAIPVFSLLAILFPAINQFLFSWLEPALKTMR
jgi:hypothetical protein